MTNSVQAWQKRMARVSRPASSTVKVSLAGSILFVSIEPFVVERHVAAAPIALEGLQLAASTWALLLPDLVPAADYRDS